MQMNCFTSGHSIAESKNQLSLTSSFKEHQRCIIVSKAELIVFSKIVRNNQKNFQKLTVFSRWEIKYLGGHIDNRLTFQSKIKILLKKDSWNKNHLGKSHLFTKIIIKINFECSCFESPQLLCRSLSIDWKIVFMVIIKTNQRGLKSFFLSVEIWVNQRTWTRTLQFTFNFFIETKRLSYFWKKNRASYLLSPKNGSIASFLVNSTITPNKKFFL